MRLSVIPILLGLSLVQSAQALDFHPIESVTLEWTEPGIFQFDSLTIPVGVSVFLPSVDADLAAPTAYFNVTGNVLLEGALLAPGWNISIGFNGSFVSTPSSRIESHSLTLKSLGSGSLQLDGDIVIAGSSIDVTAPTSGLSGSDITTNSGLIRAPQGEIILEQGGDITLSESGSLTLNAPVPEPKTYAMLLAGLGLVGYVVRKRV